MARLTEVELLPSFGNALVTKSTWGRDPNDADKRIEVRRLLNDSAICDCGLFFVINSMRNEGWRPVRNGGSTRGLRGMIPREGSPDTISACSGVRTVVSTASSTNASAIPPKIPSNRLNSMFRGIFGLDGEVGTRAASTILMLLDFRPADTPACFNFSRRSS